jgi:ribosomal protein S12 methylthiotransferase
LINLDALGLTVDSGKPSQKIYYLDPFGCVKNQVDAETMMAILDRSGWVRAEEPGGADLIIVNSCGFIESAKQESINAVLAYRKQYPGKKILLAGCLAQRYAETLANELGEADMFFGNRDLSRITEAAEAAMAKAAPGSNTTPGGNTVPDAAPGGTYSRVLVPRALNGSDPGTGGPSGGGDSPETGLLTGERPLLSLPGSAYVKISEGCNNRCSFCAIPGIRGPLRSRPVRHIVAECRQLLGRGIRELCLIGQDLGAYGEDLPRGLDSTAGTSLPDLLEAISALPGHFWVRLLYIHPDNFPRPILELCRRDKRFLPYFDLPFQHGSVAILQAMNRRGSAEAYLALIAEIRGALPGAVIRSTFLTGFPGETEEDFRVLLDFQAKAELDWAGAFTYSREEDTPAYAMKSRVPKKIAAQRKALIEEQQAGITEGRMDRFIGHTLEVLIEEAVDEAVPGKPGESGEEGIYLGRLYCQAPEVDGSAVIRSDVPLTPGTFIQGRVFGRAGFDLEVGIS